MLHFALLLECQFSGRETWQTFLQCFSHHQLLNGFDCWQFVVNASRISQSYFCIVRPMHISLALAVRAVSLFSSQAAALVSPISVCSCTVHVYVMNEVNSQTKTKTYWSKTLDSSFNRENVITNLSTLSLKLKFNNLNQKILLGKLEQILLNNTWQRY